MRITFFAHGTRGDIWPVVALASSMAARDHEVTVALPEEFTAFARGAGVPTAPLPFNLVAWLASPDGQRCLHTGGITFMRRYQAEVHRHDAAFDDAYRAAAAGAEAIVAMHYTWDRALAMADLLGVPIATVYPVPLMPSREYASLVLTKGKLRNEHLRYATGRLTSRLWWHDSAASTRAFRCSLGLSECSTATFDRLQQPGALGLHTVSQALFPRPTDWPAHLKMTGPWRMPPAVRDGVDEGLPAGLERWLDAGPEPIFLGFGSMPVLDPQALIDDIVAVTTELGQRAIVNADWAVEDRYARTLPDHVYAVGNVDHDRLLLRCSAAVHHGGAGTTLTSTRAGCPTMVCSLLADQPWWGERLTRLGVGTHTPYSKLDRARLRDGLQVLLRPEVKARAADLGAAIRAEPDGLPLAAQTLDDWLVTAEPTPQPALSTNGGVRARAQLRLRRTRGLV